MTNYGLYGTVLSIDEDTNMALIETTPGTVLKIHRQTILKAVDMRPDVSDAVADGATERSPGSTKTTPIVVGDPEFGERVGFPRQRSRCVRQRRRRATTNH
jgi:preprotein translocase subunit YajC